MENSPSIFSILGKILPADFAKLFFSNSNIMKAGPTMHHFEYYASEACYLASLSCFPNESRTVSSPGDLQVSPTHQSTQNTAQAATSNSFGLVTLMVTAVLTLSGFSFYLAQRHLEYQVTAQVKIANQQLVKPLAWKF